MKKPGPSQGNGEAQKGPADFEEQYRSIVQNTHDGIVIIDDQFKVIYVNDQMCRISGYTEQEIVGQDFLRFVAEESKPVLEDYYSRRIRGEEAPARYEMYGIRKDGTKRCLELKVALFQDDHGRVRTLAQLLDITRRKEMEEALRESEEKYRLVVETAREAILIARDVKLDFVNQATVEMIGYTEEELTSRPFTDFIHPDDRTMVAENHIRRLLGETLIPIYVFRVIRRDGAVRWVEINATAITWKGRRATLNFLNDITERKAAEDALRESESTLKSLFLAAPIGIGLVSDRIVRRVNDRICEMTGYGREEIIDRSARLFYPTDADFEFVGREKYEQISQRGTGAVETVWQRKDGRLIDILLSSTALDPSNLAAGVTFTALDITERKRAENAVKRSEEHYRLLAENIRDVVWTMDMNLNITYISPSVQTHLGYTPEECMAKPLKELMTPQSLQKARKLYQNAMDLVADPGRRELNDAPSIRVEHIHKDGSLIWFEVKVAFIRDPEGRAGGFLGLSRDITEQRKAEEAKRESMERLRKTLGATVQAMAVTVETRDPYTAGHQRRVADLARTIATEMKLAAEQIDGIRTAAIIHDLGKISVPAEILSKPTKLTALEFSLIKTHAQAGFDILKDIEFPWPVARIVLEHHERMDGSGYPNGLRGDRLLLESRILAVADVVEAMASHRPYRPGRGVQAAMSEIGKNKGILYDPEVVAACLLIFSEKGYRLVD